MDDSVKASVVQDHILDHLGFASMNEREEEVASAHRKTFSWIFEGSTDNQAMGQGHGHNFRDWLVNADAPSIYWIDGKPGSGKSTLLRFIHKDDRTLQLLQKWADPFSLTTAGFFFWISGAPEQRSQVGLLRSLLFQLLSKHRRLISITFPTMWSQLLPLTSRERLKVSMSWSLPDLKVSLQRLVMSLAERNRTCLFIDGLDELEGEHEDMLEFFFGLVDRHGRHLKLCLSSRPFPVFEKAFATCPTLKLQNLTSGDMIKYANDKLVNNRSLRKILEENPKCREEVVWELASRADGVFLWIRIVLKAMTKPDVEYHTCSDVMEQLEQYPRDLNDLFNLYLFVTQAGKDVLDAAMIFQLIRAKEIVLNFTKDKYGASLTLWELGLAFTNPTVKNATAGIGEVEKRFVIDTCTRTKERIDMACGGLLELHPKGDTSDTRSMFPAPKNPLHTVAGSKVTYIHRTARDFLMSSSTWNRLLTITACENFDPHLHLLKSHILQFQLPLEEPEHHRRVDEWWPDIVLAMTHARYARPNTGSQQRTLLDELYSTVDWYWARRKNDPEDNWPKWAFGSYEERRDFVFDDPFLLLAAKFGLTQYLEAKFRLDGIPQTDGQPVLQFATHMLANRRNSIFPLSSPDLIVLLLENGQNPNQPYRDSNLYKVTPWIYVLRCAREANRRGWIKPYDSSKDGTLRWAKIVQTCLDHGANPNALILPEKWDPSATALEVVSILRTINLVATSCFTTSFPFPTD